MISTREQHSEQLATGTDYLRHASTAGGGRATSFATRRRFWAIAPSVNSSCAPYGPHNRSRPSLKMRSRCRRAFRRACDCGATAQTLACRQVLGRHRRRLHGCCAGLCARAPSDSIEVLAGKEGPQSEVLARYSNVTPSWTRPVVYNSLPCGQT